MPRERGFSRKGSRRLNSHFASSSSTSSFAVSPVRLKFFDLNLSVRCLLFRALFLVSGVPLCLASDEQNKSKLNEWDIVVQDQESKLAPRLFLPPSSISSV